MRTLLNYILGGIILVFHFAPLSAQSKNDTTELAQEKFQTDYQLRIKKAKNPIKIDGKLEELDWTTAEKNSEMWEFFPRRDGKAKRQTQIQMTYDENFIYIGATCIDSLPYVISTLKRDVGFWESDGFCIVLDPINLHTNGFRFGVSPYGVQHDALVGAPSEESEEWDAKWYVETQRLAGGNWTAEVAIPFKSLRYDAAKTTWGLQIVRNNPKFGQYHTWTPVPVQFDGIHLSYTGALSWDAPPPASKSNIAVLPYVSAQTYKDFSANETDGGLDVGLDAKVALTPSLNLDLTVNPDFSQVDVDQQVTNLTRFSVQFPERRPFFLENSDILTQFGIPPARPFWSRSIGLDENRRAVPILYGLRLSGNLNKSLRVNALNMQTASDGNGGGSQNYSAVAVQQAVDGHGSWVKGMFLNRQKMDGFQPKTDNFGRNIGAETYLVSKNQKIGGWLGLHRSFKPDVKSGNPYMGSSGFEYRGKNLYVLNDFFHCGENYYADMGFINRIENYDAQRDTVIRLGFMQNYTEINYVIRPKSSSKVNQHFSGIENFVVFNPNGSLNEWFNRYRHFITFKNTSELRFRLDYSLVNLPFPTSFISGHIVPVQQYWGWTPSIEFNSDQRRNFLYRTQISYGRFYGGSNQRITVGGEYRLQPNGVFKLDIEYNKLILPNYTGGGCSRRFLVNSAPN